MLDTTLVLDTRQALGLIASARKTLARAAHLLGEEHAAAAPLAEAADSLSAAEEALLAPLQAGPDHLWLRGDLTPLGRITTKDL